MNASGLCLGRTQPPADRGLRTKGGAVYEIDRTGDIGSDHLQVCFGSAQHRNVGMAPARTLPRHEATPIDSFLEFFQSIQTGAKPQVNFDAAVRVQAVLDAADRSAGGGGGVDLPTDG